MNSFFQSPSIYIYMVIFESIPKVTRVCKCIWNIHIHASLTFGILSKWLSYKIWFSDTMAENINMGFSEAVWSIWTIRDHIWTIYDRRWRRRLSLERIFSAFTKHMRTKINTPSKEKQLYIYIYWFSKVYQKLDGYVYVYEIV